MKGAIPLSDLSSLLLALTAAYGCAATAGALRHGLSGRVGRLLAWSFVPLVLVCPALIAPGHVGPRAGAAFASGEVAFKMVDFLRRWDRWEPAIVFREYVRFLIPLPILATVYPEHKRRRMKPERRWPRVRQLLGGIAGTVLAVVLLRALSRIGWVRSSFALNHVVMLATFVLAIESIARGVCALERLAGYDTTPIIHNAYQSRTVAEFWRRYNHRVHDWLDRHVFRPAGGRRAPLRAVFLVFLVSGLFHEAMFALATSRLTGYQLAFFLLQAPAVLVSKPLERLARRGGIPGKLLAHAATIVFLAVTSVLFFDGVDRVFPFLYVSRTPLP